MKRASHYVLGFTLGLAAMSPVLLGLWGPWPAEQAAPQALYAQDVDPQPGPPTPEPAPAEPFVTLPQEITGEPGAFIAVRPNTNGRIVRYIATTPGLNVFPADMLRDATATVVTAQTGRYQLVAYTALGDVPSEPAVVSIVVGAAPPPVPPSPPTPPNPPAPLPTAGLRVLVLEETDDRDNLPGSQQALLVSLSQGKAAQHLDAVCAKEAGQPEWRILDDDADGKYLSPLWKEALDRLKADSTPSPKVLISNGVTGFQGPLPKTVEEWAALVAKFEGK